MQEGSETRRHGVELAAAPVPARDQGSALVVAALGRVEQAAGALRSISTLPATIRVLKRSDSAKNASTEPGWTVQ